MKVDYVREISAQKSFLRIPDELKSADLPSFFFQVFWSADFC